jgi:hypothetical protein
MVTVRVQVEESSWSLLLRNVFEVADVQGGSAETTERGVRITPAAGASELRVKLS